MGRLSGKTGNVAVGLQTIFDGETALDEQVISNVTYSLDTSDYKVGNGSAKLAVGASFTTGIIGSKVVTSMDLTPYTQLMGWFKSSVALNASDNAFVVDDTALCASPTRTINLPALAANTWTYVKVTDAFTGCTAIISVGLKQVVDKGAMNIWCDLVQAAKVIAGIKNWTLNYKIGTQEVTGFDSGGVKEFAATITEWNGTFDGFKDALPLSIGTLIGLEMQEYTTATMQARGTGIITDFTDSVDVAGIVTYKYAFTGTKELVLPSA